MRLNAELTGKNQELDAIFSTAPDIIFSRRPMVPGIMSATASMTLPVLSQFGEWFWMARLCAS